PDGRNHAVGDGVGFDDIAIAGEQENLLPVGNDEQRLELTQQLVGTPVLGELDGRAAEVAAVLLELGLKTREERKRIRCGPCKAREHLVVIKAANLARGLLHHRRAERYLAVGGHDHGAAALDAQYGRGSNPATVAEVKGRGCHPARPGWVIAEAAGA